MFGRTAYRGDSFVYTTLSQDSLQEKDEIEAGYSTTPRRVPVHYYLCWSLVVVLACINVYLLILLNTNDESNDGFEKGFATDLAAARSLLTTQQVRFTGSPSFKTDGTEFLMSSTGPRYTGDPDDEMDAAWNSLTDGRYFLLSDDEARDAWGPGYTEFWNEERGGYLAGFDMLHLLHCLNHIREGFYPDRYTHNGVHGILHRDHCIDNLRQMLQCNADITPIPSRYYTGLGHNYIDSDRVHTCRNFDVLRAWTWERHNGSLAVARRSRGFS